jgi:anaerobic glycerol-3-phosphate dehydrogenase
MKWNIIVDASLVPQFAIIIGHSRVVVIRRDGFHDLSEDFENAYAAAHIVVLENEITTTMITIPTF